MGLAGTLEAPQVVPDADILEYKRLLAEQLQAARAIEHPGISPEKTRMEMLTEKLGEVVYVPSVVQPAQVRTIRNGFNITESRQPAELVQPEWNNRMP